MGDKQDQCRKYLFLYCASLLVFMILMNGCTTITAIPGELRWYNQLQSAEESLDRGNYDRALEEYEEILSQTPKSSPGDRVLFQMGVVAAHPDNPDTNYTRSLRYFRQLIDDFPGGDYQEEAEVMVHLMMGRIQDKQRIESYKKYRKYKKYQELVADYERKWKTCEARTEELEAVVDNLKKQLDAFKAIDIETEEKKREDLLRK